MSQVAQVENNGIDNGLIPQSHGGALKPGGTFGNRGGTGRPPDVIRLRARESFDSWLDRLNALKDDPNFKPSIREITAAMAETGRFGLGEKVWTLDESAQLRAVGQATAEFFALQGSPETFDSWVKYIEAYVQAL